MVHQGACILCFVDHSWACHSCNKFLVRVLFTGWYWHYVSNIRLLLASNMARRTVSLH